MLSRLISLWTSGLPASSENSRVPFGETLAGRLMTMCVNGLVDEGEIGTVTAFVDPPTPLAPFAKVTVPEVEPVEKLAYCVPAKRITS